MRNKSLLVLVSILVAIAVICFANAKGWWLATFVVGLCLAFLPIRSGAAVLISAVASALGWFVPLVLLGFQYNLHNAAAVIAAVMGFGIKLWWIADLVTVLTGALLGLAGTWFATAVIALVRPARFQTSRPSGAVASGASQSLEG